MSEPKVSFPPELPISAHVRELALAIDGHPVVVVEGETGSGKTTQLPKICLAMGRGLEKQIGVTEPRRIAATSVAARVASELGVELGREVGCQIRFSNQTSRDTYVKFMTDGILLAEIPRDRELRAYDTIILDEAHERSLNIDFLMGHLKRVLEVRNDLRVIVSSATMATDRISAFFGGAPIVRVSGRTFPVETIYAPIDPSEPDVPDAIAKVIDDVTELDPRGDVLVFLPGEREIRETANALAHRSMPRTTVLPLFGRLARADQQRVFESTVDRKVILATNVAETSLTIPGVTTVIDTGFARVNRYQARTGVTQLLVEPISRASAEQRKGRAGRTQGGVCFRLYPEEDFGLRSENTDPEILRVGLSGAILQFMTLGLGDLRTFPLLDPPPKRAIAEGYRVLEELGAIGEDEAITPIGRTLARFPLDPRLGRMVLAGDDEGVREEVLIIAAALALQDPRERPQGLEAKADQAHRRFRVEGSDFLSLLELFRFYEREATSTSRARRVCRDTFLSYTRMREWLDTRDQLARQFKEERDRGGVKAPPRKGDALGDRIHRAILTGLASRIGMWNAESRSYVGARQTRFVLHPSSALAKKPPPWVVVAELVETSRLFGRVAAAIDPTWLESTAGHLVRRSYGESHFAEKRGEPMVKEQATLYGLPIVRERSVPLGPIDPAAARRCFILDGLVRGGYVPRPEDAYANHNAAVIERWNHLRSRARKQGMEVDLEERTKLFFEARIPDDVHDARTFDAWRKQAEAKDAATLRISMEDLGGDGADEVSAADYPDELVVDGMRLAVRYAFDPSEDADGATLDVPIELLSDLEPELFDWTIPGWHARKIAELLHGLPKATQRAFGVDSIDALAARISEKLVPFQGAMREALSRAIWEQTGVRVGPTRLAIEDLPGYLRFHFRVVQGDKTIAESPDLVDLQTRFRERSREAFRAATRLSPERVTRYPSTGLGAAVKLGASPPARLGSGVDAHAALTLHEGSVETAWSASSRRADAMTRRALPTLYAFALSTSIGALEKKLSGRIEPETRRDIVERALDETFDIAGPIPRTEKAFQERVLGGDKRLGAVLAELGRLGLDIADELEPTRRLARSLVGQPGAPRAALDDVGAQLDHLVARGYMRRLSRARLASIPMYVRGARIRLERLPNGPQKDKAKAESVLPFWNEWLAKRGELLASGVPLEEVDAFRWLIEEFRVAVFAPEAGKPLSMSAKRLAEAWADLARA